MSASFPALPSRVVSDLKRYSEKSVGVVRITKRLVLVFYTIRPLFKVNIFQVVPPFLHVFVYAQLHVNDVPFGAACVYGLWL